MQEMLIRRKSWIVVNSQPHREAFAIENLLRQGFNTYCPLVLKQIRKSRRPIEVRRPLFPGYLFVEHIPNVLNYRSLMGTFGVRTIVRAGDRPALLDDAFIAGLRLREVDGIVRKPAERFRIGQSVVVQGGSLDGLIGEIIDLREKDRIVLLLNLLNQQTKVHVDAQMLAPA